MQQTMLVAVVAMVGLISVGATRAAGQLSIDQDFGARRATLYPNIAGKSGIRDAKAPAIFPDGSLLFPLSGRDLRRGHSVGYSKYDRHGKPERSFGAGGTAFVNFPSNTFAVGTHAQALPNGGALLSGWATVPRGKGYVDTAFNFGVKVNANGLPDLSFNEGQPLMFPKEFGGGTNHVWAAPSGAVFATTQYAPLVGESFFIEIRKAGSSGIDPTFGTNGVQHVAIPDRVYDAETIVTNGSLTFKFLHEVSLGDGFNYGRCAFAELTEAEGGLDVNARSTPGQIVHIPTSVGDRGTSCGDLQPDGDDWVFVGKPSRRAKPRNAYLVKFRPDGSVVAEFGTSGFAYLPKIRSKRVETYPRSVGKLPDGSYVVAAGNSVLYGAEPPSFLARISSNGAIERDAHGNWRQDFRKGVGTPWLLTPHDGGLLMGVQTGFFRPAYRRLESR